MHEKDMKKQLPFFESIFSGGVSLSLGFFLGLLSAGGALFLQSLIFFLLSSLSSPSFSPSSSLSFLLLAGTIEEIARGGVLFFLFSPSKKKAFLPTALGVGGAFGGLELALLFFSSTLSLHFSSFLPFFLHIFLTFVFFLFFFLLPPRKALLWGTCSSSLLHALYNTLTFSL